MYAGGIASVIGIFPRMLASWIGKKPSFTRGRERVYSAGDTGLFTSGGYQVVKSD
jgi:hypothetical protein